jgi:hypothetical protein
MTNQHQSTTESTVPRDKHTFMVPSTILDVIHKWLSPGIAFAIWGLLRAGVYSRGWFYGLTVIFSALWGFRTFISIVNQRLTTLKRIAPIVNAAVGTREEQNRRHGFMRSRATTLAFDLFSIFVGAVLVPASILFFGATFNSYYFAVVVFTLSTLDTVFLVLAITRLHSQFNFSRKLQAERAATNLTTKKENDNGLASSAFSSLPGGMSALEPSE